MTVNPVLAEKEALVAEIPVKPVRRVVTFPEPSMLAMNELVLVQVDVLETSLVEPSDKLRMADNFVGVLEPINT